MGAAVGAVGEREGMLVGFAVGVAVGDRVIGAGSSSSP